MTEDKMEIPNTRQDCKIPGIFTCTIPNVLYLIVWTKCPTGGLYLGEIGQKLRTKMNPHHHTMKEKRQILPEAKHLVHNISGMKIPVLKGHFKSQRDRRI